MGNDPPNKVCAGWNITGIGAQSQNETFLTFNVYGIMRMCLCHILSSTHLGCKTYRITNNEWMYWKVWKVTQLGPNISKL